jgi:hypothetical protein
MSIYFPGEHTTMKHSVARFFFVGTLYQNGGKYTKRTHTVPNGRKIDQIYQHFPFEDPPKIGIFGLKIYPNWQPCSDRAELLKYYANLFLS